jgi:lactate dehydrogenase-like 2-hydroxyacid dehydrogenase
VHFAFHAELLELAKASDVLVLACPANEATRNLIGPEVLDALGSEGYLVNVARGAVLDETALIEALEGGRIAGAALDVFADEPHVSERLRVHPRVLLTPHIASATVESRRQMADLVLGNLDAFLNGGTLATPVA